jgi:two-component system cell cycle response regulator DivK
MPKILLVEDNEMNRDMLSRRLIRSGYEVLLAVDGAQGVAMAASDAPDLVLMDMSLPVLDGWEATRRLKSDPTTRGLPVIALTAHAMAGDEKKAREAGCDDFDTKPVEYARLLSKIEGLLQKRKAGRRAGTGPGGSRTWKRSETSSKRPAAALVWTSWYVST